MSINTKLPKSITISIIICKAGNLPQTDIHKSLTNASKYTMKTKVFEERIKMENKRYQELIWSCGV